MPGRAAAAMAVKSDHLGRRPSPPSSQLVINLNPSGATTAAIPEPQGHANPFHRTNSEKLGSSFEKTADSAYRRDSFIRMGLMDTSDIELQLPAHSEWQDLVKLLTSGNQWVPRLLFLTPTKLCWTHQGNEDCLIDYIKLIDILIAEKIPYRPGDTIIPGLGSRSLSADYVLHSPKSPMSPKFTDSEALHEDVKDFYGFQVITKEAGGNGGRTYLFEVWNENQLQEWIQKIEDLRHKANENHELEILPKFERWQLVTSRMFLSTPSSIIVSTFILANFIINMLEAQYTPEKGSETEEIFDWLDVGFTCVFGVELLINMFAHFWAPFWNDWWNVFDFVIVIFSCAAIFLEDVPLFNLFRLLRVFRVLRLFRKLRSLRIITNAILASLLPVLDACIILAVVTAVYAILGVELYGASTPEFKNFVHSMFSMYQVATGDSWASSIARGMFDDDNKSFGIMAFFTTYTIITGMILLNVLIAVLLDNFTRSIVLEEEFDHTPWDTAHLVSPLDPLMKHLCQVESEEGISKIITDIFYNIDIDGSNSAGFTEFRAGLSKLLIWPKIHLSADEYKYMVQTNPGTDEFGQFDHDGFQMLMRSEMTRYSKRMLVKNVEKGTPDTDNARMMIALRRLTDLVEGIQATLQTNSSKPSAPTLAGKPKNFPEVPAMLSGKRHLEDIEAKIMSLHDTSTKPHLLESIQKSIRFEHATMTQNGENPQNLSATQSTSTPKAPVAQSGSVRKKTSLSYSSSTADSGPNNYQSSPGIQELDHSEAGHAQVSAANTLRMGIRTARG